MHGNSTAVAKDFTDVCVGLTIFVSGVFGGAVNVHNVIAMYYIKDFCTSYGYLCRARAIFNIINLSVFVFYTAPDTVFKFLPAGDEVGRILGMISGVCYSAIPILQVAVAYNRMIALFFPLFYGRLCTRKWAKVVIGFGLSYGILLGVHDLIAKCRFVYIPVDLSWVYQGCPRKVLEIKFIYPVLLCAGISLGINVIVATRLVIETTKNGTYGSERRRNVRLFWQGFAQELFFANDLIWQDFISSLISTRIWWFLSNTLMWELAHVCDGLMFLVFDPNLRYFLWKTPSNLSGSASPNVVLNLP